MRLFFTLIPALLAISCARENRTRAEGPARPIGAAIEIPAPLGLPPVPVPEDNPATATTIALGRKLFFETKLSADHTVSCATCHNPNLGFADGQAFSKGVGGKAGDRNAPSILNAAYYPLQFWDGRSATLETQAHEPIANPREMNLPASQAIARLEADAAYRALFEGAFGPGSITIDKIARAIASFERTILSGNSAFDRYFYLGDKKAMSPAAIRGLQVFQDSKRGNCVTCHTIGKDHALFTDGKFHNIGVGLSPEGELIDLGRFKQTKNESDKGAFKTPTLRNVALTAPYMHDGSLKTLKDVVDFYVGGGSSNPHLDKEIRELNLTAQERMDLVAFMEELTGERPPNATAPGGK